MAKVSAEVINAIREAAKQLANNHDYQWGHMGACNCGFLAQQVTQLSKAEIHRRALLGHGDWSEQLNDYCPTSGLPMDDVISELLAFGFDADDLRHLERLSDANVLRALPLGERNLKHNVNADVVKYMHTWANLLEAEWLKSVQLVLPQEWEVV